MKTPYKKRTLSFNEQLSQLKERGLLIENDSRALHYLTHINYYRLSAYMYPFLKNKGNHLFQKGTTFQNILDIYNFDRELRLILMNALERIEISVRTSIIYVLSHKYGPFWLNNKNIFKNKDNYHRNYYRIVAEIKRSREKFIKHFHSKYCEDIPPLWITLETVSFGVLSLLFENLKVYKDMKEIARMYRLNHVIFTSWLHSIVYIRNICAHHSRLWNRELAIPPALPKDRSILEISNSQGLRNDRVFIIFLIIRYFLSIINPSNHFIQKIQKLIEKYPMIDLAPMGFPKNWKDEPLFTDKLKDEK